MRTIVILPLVAALVFGLSGCGSGKSSSAASTNGSGAPSSSNAMTNVAQPAGGTTSAMAGSAPNCGAVQAVWVNLKTRVYHEPGDPAYGNTKHGEYLCPSQARAQGFRPAGGGMRRHGMKRSSASNSSM